MKKNNKDVADKTLAKLEENRDVLAERIGEIDSEKVEKPYVAAVWQAIKELKVTKSMNDMSAVLGKSGNYFYAIMNMPQGTQRRIGLTFSPAKKLHTLTDGLFDVDRMLPKLESEMIPLDYFKLKEGREVAPEAVAVLEKLGYKKRKTKVKHSESREVAA